MSDNPEECGSWAESWVAERGRFGGRVIPTVPDGDAPPLSTCPQPTSLAAAPLAIFRQALRLYG
jgi:hypothetical protein